MTQVCTLHLVQQKDLATPSRSPVSAFHLLSAGVPSPIRTATQQQALRWLLSRWWHSRQKNGSTASERCGTWRNSLFWPWTELGGSCRCPAIDSALLSFKTCQQIMINHPRILSQHTIKRAIKYETWEGNHLGIGLGNHTFHQQTPLVKCPATSSSIACWCSCWETDEESMHLDFSLCTAPGSIQQGLGCSWGLYSCAEQF